MTLVVVCAVLGSACAIYLSCRSSSSLASVPWIPRAIGEWADQHGRIRNFPAYFLLACPFLLIGRETYSRVWATIGVGVFGTGLEWAEVFFPGRWVEWQDIAWSWAGAVTALLCFEGGRRVLERVWPGVFCQQPS
jgi:hypothetical protein